MQKTFRQFQLYLLMMFFWIIINGASDIRSILLGTGFSIVIIRMTYHVIFELDDNIVHLPPAWRFLWFGVVVLISIVKASIDNVVRILKNTGENVVFEMTLETHNTVIITLIANAITLTPGTITLDVEDSKLIVLGYALNDHEIELMKKEILSYQKPFIYRRI